jgi:hypothetical protein
VRKGGKPREGKAAAVCRRHETMQIVTVRGREGGMLRGRGVRDHQGCHLTRGSVVPAGGNKHADDALVRTARIMLG